MGEEMRNASQPSTGVLLFTGLLLLLLLPCCGTTTEAEGDNIIEDGDQENLEPYCVPGAHWENGTCVPDELDDDNDTTPIDGDTDPLTDGDAESNPTTDGDLDETEDDSDENNTPSDGDQDSPDRDTDNEDIPTPSLEQIVPDSLAVDSEVPLSTLVNGEPVHATWQSDNDSVATVNEQHVVGVSVGEATLHAQLEPHRWPAHTVRVMERDRIEARGIWVNRWAFSSAADVATIMERCANAGFNQVYFQVRGVFDAYYDSSLEPWARGLSGTLGNDPGWDPLQTALDEAHQRGMELHAWINVFTAWDGSGQPTGSHPLADHPDWRMVDSSGTAMPYGSGYVWVAPGIPAVRQHNTAVAVDIATHYEVDGIHLDRVRYPSRSYSFDDQSLAACQQEQGASACSGDDYMDWQRRQVNRQVAEMYEALRDAAPDVVLSAAVFGIYQDVFGWNGVTEGYEDWLQDPKAWDEQEIIDVIIPMIYWVPTTTYGDFLDFRLLTDTFAEMFSNRFFYAGSDVTDGSAKTNGKTTIDWVDIEDQVLYTRQAGLVEGWVLYDYGTMNSAGYWDELKSGPFAHEAQVPFFWWK